MIAVGNPVGFSIKQFGNTCFDKKTWYMAYVPLTMIKYEKWDSGKYLQNNKIIETLGTVLPVNLGDKDSLTGKYELCDGNHRCFCVNDLGYTHIPAIIHKNTIDDAFIKIEIGV